MALSGPWPSQAGSGGSGSRVICRCVCVCVLVRAVIAERSWQVSWFLLEKDALSFLHPRVVLHQLRVQKGILWDAVLYPLYQALWRDTEKLHFSNSRGSLLPQSILSFPYKARKRWRLRATRGQKLLIIFTSTTVDFWVLFGKPFILIKSFYSTKAVLLALHKI